MALEKLFYEEKRKLWERLEKEQRGLKQTYLRRINSGYEEYGIPRNIEISDFSIEERVRFDAQIKVLNEVKAKISVFDSCVLNMIARYEKAKENSQKFRNLILPCDKFDVDDENNIVKCYISVLGFSIESPFEMSFSEYAKLYSIAFYRIVDKLSKEHNESIQDACLQYLNEQKEQEPFTI